MTLRIDPQTGTWQFAFGSEWRSLSDPHGLPTGRQLVWLARNGLLEFRSAPGPPLTKLEAAQAIDRRLEREAA